MILYISDQKDHGIYRLDANNDGISRLPHPGYMRATSYLSPEENHTRHQNSTPNNDEDNSIVIHMTKNQENTENKTPKRRRLIQ